MSIVKFMLHDNNTNITVNEASMDVERCCDQLSDSCLNFGPITTFAVLVYNDQFTRVFSNIGSLGNDR